MHKQYYHRFFPLAALIDIIISFNKDFAIHPNLNNHKLLFWLNNCIDMTGTVLDVFNQAQV